MLKNCILTLLICNFRNCIEFIKVKEDTNLISVFPLSDSEIILSSCCCQSSRATNVGKFMPHPGQAFLKNDAKRKRDYEKLLKNCQENIKR